MSATKAQRAFFRKLYLAYLIDAGQHSARSLEQETGMPRRTIQDTLADLGDIGMRCHFVQRQGGRRNEGHYVLAEWGPIRRDWVVGQLEHIRAVLAQ